MSTLTQEQVKNVVNTNLKKKQLEVETTSQTTHKQTRDEMIQELRSMNKKSDQRTKILEEIVKKMTKLQQDCGSTIVIMQEKLKNRPNI